MNGRLHVLVPGAGAGLRFHASSGAEGEVADPKQLLEVAGQPVLDWSCRALLPAQPASMTIALPEGREQETNSRFEAILQGSDCRLHLVLGGDTRQESVWLCLSHVLGVTDPSASSTVEGSAVKGGALDGSVTKGPVSESDLVLIHDAARPALAASDLEAVIEAARSHEVDGAVLGRPVTDTLKRCSEGILGETVDRTDLFRVETPQVFRLGVLARAMEKARDSGWQVTDESTLVERVGGRILAVTATSENPKLTTVSDLRRLEWLLAERTMQL